MKATDGCATRAVFLDRDGTLVQRYHYPSRPEHLRLYDGIAALLAALRQAGFRLVVVTNQSGIARGYFTEFDLDRMHAHLRTQLATQGVELDAIYHCPHHPDGQVAGLAVRCDCRKPAPGLPLRAARELRLDLTRSWFVGDILDDIEAGARAGCRTVLVDLGTEPAPQSALRQPDFVARDTPHALAIILAAEGLGPAADTAYRPTAWRAGEAMETRRAASSRATAGEAL
jgi:D-glycero-D-manno-heptose 1,7-bisphosphate phosphatase